MLLTRTTPCLQSKNQSKRKNFWEGLPVFAEAFSTRRCFGWVFQLENRALIRWICLFCWFPLILFQVCIAQIHQYLLDTQIPAIFHRSWHQHHALVSQVKPNVIRWICEIPHYIISLSAKGSRSCDVWGHFRAHFVIHCTCHCMSDICKCSM